MLGAKNYELLNEVQEDDSFVRQMNEDYSGFNLYELDFGIMKYKIEQDKIKIQQIDEL